MMALLLFFALAGESLAGIHIAMTKKKLDLFGVKNIEKKMGET